MPPPELVDLPPDLIADPDRDHDLIGELSVRGEELLPAICRDGLPLAAPRADSP